MNNSLNNSHGSSGFMYYSLESPTKEEANTKVNSSDFLALGDCSPSSQAPQFNPSNCSSPYNINRNKQRHFNKRGWKHNLNQHYNNRSYNSSNSFNQNSSSTWNKSRDNSFYSAKSTSDSVNKSSYLHPSFMEDPWAVLEKQHAAKKTTNQEKTTKEFSSSDSSNTEEISPEV